MAEPMSPGPAKPEPERSVIHNELGRTGLAHYSGLLYEEFLPQLQGQRGVKMYKEMSENSPTIGSMMFAIESTLRSVPWGVEATASTNPEAADLIESCMDDMSHTWEDFISEILTMLRYGWSYFEIVYKRREGYDSLVKSKHSDGRIGWRKFAPRAQETLYRWEIDAHGGTKGMHQYPIPTGTPGDNRVPQSVIFLPIERCLLFRTTSMKNSPEGRSMLRNAYRPYHFAKRLEESEAIGVHRDLAGVPIARVPIELLTEPRSAEAAQTYNYVKDVVTKTHNNSQAGIVWPKVLDEQGNDLYEFELITSGGRRQHDTGAIIQRYVQQMAMTTLADFILLGHENVGSFALSSDKTELFAVALGAYLDSIEDVLNRHAIPRLLKLNGFPVDENIPVIRHGDIEKPDLQQLITFVQGLAGSGAPLFPDIVLENRLRELADLPTITEEERERIQSEQAQQQQEMMMGPGLGIGGQPGGPGAMMGQMGLPPGQPGRPEDGKTDEKQDPSQSQDPFKQGRPAAGATTQNPFADAVKKVLESR